MVGCKNCKNYVPFSGIQNLIPKHLPVTPVTAINHIKFAGIENEAVIIGIINKIEIWDPAELQKWEDEMADKDDFEDLANDISF